jgi:hypothetical protein
MMIDTIPLAIDRDVRHLGPDDVLSSVSISNVTKQLSERDYLLAASFNGLLAELKSLDQPMPVVLPRISLPAMATEWLGNFRIPAGYSASVLNAIVASSPIAGKATLEVVHSSGTYGQSGSGEGVTRLVTTVGEYSVAGAYVGEGELIFRVTSSSTRRIAVSASVLIALRRLA